MTIFTEQFKPYAHKQRLAIVGDLHYETDQQAGLAEAQAQLIALAPEAVVSLGDQGGYSHCGTRLSFEEGRDYFSDFGVPFYPLIGNHDMEGKEFETDEAAVAAWCEVFGRERPYYSIDWGTALGICLSQTHFRQNEGSHHEVHIDEQQLAWFIETVTAHPNRPIFVFSHAPILGSGVRILQDLHLKGPNAYLNHYTYPQQFMEVVKANPQIKLWISGHIHVGHHYDDTINQVGHCTFVHGGVIGNHTRDGDRHTRFLTFDESGFELYTVDHLQKQLYLDYTLAYESNQGERQRFFAPRELSRFFPPTPFPNGDNLITIGNSVFAIHRNMLVEYDRQLQAPVGIVAESLHGAEVATEAEALIIKRRFLAEERRERNAYGRYLRVFFPNPWNKS